MRPAHGPMEPSGEGRAYAICPASASWLGSIPGWLSGLWPPASAIPFDCGRPGLSIRQTDARHAMLDEPNERFRHFGGVVRILGGADVFDCAAELSTERRLEPEHVRAARHWMLPQRPQAAAGGAPIDWRLSQSSSPHTARLTAARQSTEISCPRSIRKANPPCKTRGASGPSPESADYSNLFRCCSDICAARDFKGIGPGAVCRTGTLRMLFGMPR